MRVRIVVELDLNPDPPEDWPEEYLERLVLADARLEAYTMVRTWAETTERLPIAEFRVTDVSLPGPSAEWLEVLRREQPHLVDPSTLRIDSVVHNLGAGNEHLAQDCPGGDAWPCAPLDR